MREINTLIIMVLAIGLIYLAAQNKLRNIGPAFHALMA